MSTTTWVMLCAIVFLVGFIVGVAVDVIDNYNKRNK